MGRQAKKAQDEINLADSICDPNARWVTAFSCETGVTANWGCMTVDSGQVPQIGQFVVGISTIAGTAPVVIGTTTYPGQPTFWLILAVQPSFTGQFSGDRPTANVGGATACGYECVNGCHWTGLPTATYATWNDCTNAVNTGACLVPPTHFCRDYNVFEIIYPGTVYTGSTGMDEATVLGEIISKTTSSPYSTASPIPYPYSDPGGVWDGFSSLAQMASVVGPPAIGGTSIYNPLKDSLDDCIACCGGINQPFYSSGTPNPYYSMSTHPTPHAGWAAYLAATVQTQSSASFINYMYSLGINSCGETWCTPWPGC